jgi:Lrp/AsnC family transcriptional regulator
VKVRTDSIDRQILDCLQRDGSLSTAQIARQVGLSQSPCWRRIRRLEQAGVIRGRVGLLDRRRLGLEVMVFASIKLSEHGRRALPEFEEAVTGLDEIVGAYVMTGENDYLLKVVTRDIESYERLLRSHLLQLPTVREVHSQIVLSEMKATTNLPIRLVAEDTPPG